MRILLMVLGALVGVLMIATVAAVLIGRRLPVAHTAEVAREIAAPLDRVAALVRNVAEQPAWRPDVKRIEVTRGESADGEVRYVEHGGNGRIPFRFREVVPGVEFTSTIDSDQLPFGGTWTIRLSASGTEKTRVVIREDGEVRSALFRTMSRYVFGHTRTIAAYLSALERAAR
jgi:hypothetical protein